MNLKTLFFSTIMFVSASVQAQTFTPKGNGLEAVVNGQTIEVQFYSNSIVRITKREDPEASLSKAPVVIMQPENVPVTIEDNRAVVWVSSPTITVKLSVMTGRVEIADKKGAKTFLREKDYGSQFLPVNYNGENTSLVRQAFLLDADEQVYGLGQHQTGQFSQRNRRMNLEQVNMTISMPYFYSTKGYGLLWNNESPTTWSDCRMETSFESQVGEAVDYFVIAEGSADKVLADLRKLTGQVPMNALWTYGYWQSKERYTNQEELVDAVRQYRKIKVPLDCIVQDWQYWGHTWRQWNGVTWTKEEYPDPNRMMKEIHSLNAHAIASVWPSFGEGTKIYNDFKNRGYMLGITTYPDSADVFDVYNPEARKLYWDYLNRNMFSTGLDGWWLDATEPEMPRRGEQIDAKTYLGSIRRNANAFPLYTVGDVYTRQRATSADKRVMILTRSAYLGQQRTGAFSWSGDIDANWQTLARQIPAGLNFSICGNPNWNTDIGGFWVREYPEGCNDPRYRELYVRWLQFGTFMPLMRSHGTNTPREIWQFGKRGTWAYDAIERFIRLRYALVPYIYSTAWQVSHNDDTFMRPLYMDFAGDANVLDMGSEYMFGHSLLVAPVTDPMYVDEKGQFQTGHKGTKDVYLPAGAQWYDYFTGYKYQGGVTIRRNVPINEIPLFVRSGSILPIGPDVQYTSEKKWDELVLQVYPGADGDFVLYEDEGDGYGYENGRYTEIPMHWSDATQTLTIGNRKGSFPGMLQNRTFVMKVMTGNGNKGVKSVKVRYAGQKVSVK